jgi:hypothetical protein
MNSPKSAVRRLDLLLAGLEEIILTSTDKYSYIDLQPKKVRAGNPIGRSKAVTVASAKAPYVPRELAARIRLLKAISMARPEISPAVRSVFGGKKKPSTTEIDKLTDELVRMGLLRRKE